MHTVKVRNFGHMAPVCEGLKSYILNHQSIIRVAAGYILWANSKDPVKLPIMGLSEALSTYITKYYALDIRAYRVRIMLSTAAHMGAFEEYGIYLRRGVGFTTVPAVSSQQLVKEAA